MTRLTAKRVEELCKQFGDLYINSQPNIYPQVLLDITALCDLALQSLSLESVRSEAIGYAVHNEQGYFVGLYRDASSAQLVVDRGKDGEIILPVYAAPNGWLEQVCDVVMHYGGTRNQRLALCRRICVLQHSIGKSGRSEALEEAALAIEPASGLSDDGTLLIRKGQAAIRALKESARSPARVAEGRSSDPEFEQEPPETQGTWQERCSALYQVIGCMANMFGIFETSNDVSDALDVAAGRGDVEKLLPWPKVDLRTLVKADIHSTELRK